MQWADPQKGHNPPAGYEQAWHYWKFE